MATAILILGYHSDMILYGIKFIRPNLALSSKFASLLQKPVSLNTEQFNMESLGRVLSWNYNTNRNNV